MAGPAGPPTTALVWHGRNNNVSEIIILFSVGQGIKSHSFYLVKDKTKINASDIENTISRLYRDETLSRDLLSLSVSRRISSYLVVSVAQQVARRTHDRKVVGSIPTNAVCFTVVR